ncbi:FHA domain-containing protein FhaB/FipA [Krasilnikoviella flava]|uniref:Forkhead associated (FHA) domain, binds pSer, pThr, pTyr n=1 Tax=Krasilnikoviella flava TaxID=526729 RepID=A0A1T5KD17_9MICO|nr:FHA domain-containing protein [Krasilnikoviella flava]SKC61586.1 Forkhead associated (FHA) domain, binds pSer, pThr, pTyr [Krasilnikoviella flava]
MSELTITLLRLGYLVLLWVFVLSAIAVLRRDLSPRGAPRASRAERRRAEAAPATAGASAGAAAAPAPARRSGPTRLVVTSGPLTGTTLPLSTASILIGRSPGCTLVLDDDYSSSRHARIFPQGDQWYVEDLGSTNGTFIGDTQVSGPQPLAPGVGVRIGQSVVELQG